MTDYKYLLKIEVASLVSLGISAVFLAAYAFLNATFFVNVLPPVSSALVTMLFTVMIGFFPVVLLGAPIYMALKKYHKDRWGYVFLIGLSPGLISCLSGFDLEIVVFSLVAGVVVSVATHFLCGKFNFLHINDAR